MAQALHQQLKDVGSKLESPPASKDALVKLLKQAANCLAEIDQSPLPSISNLMHPVLSALAKQELLQHQDRDVKVLVATCICEITRITAPEAPYSDDVLRDIFQLIVGTFNGLGDVNNPSFGRRVAILETLARYRSCLVMLDLECNDLIHEMFSTLLSVVRDDHPQNVVTAMQTIMVLILEESEEIQENILILIISSLGRKRSGLSMAARKLAMNIITQCAGKLGPYIKQLLVSSLTGDSRYLSSVDHHEVIYDLYQCVPQVLTEIVPYITGELLTDDLDIRRKAVQLLGDLFALPEVSISQAFRPLFMEFLKRLTDRVAEIRVSVIEHLKNCLSSNPSRPEASEIIKSLADRLLDYDENVRKQAISAVFDVACLSLDAIPTPIVSQVAERLRDKSLSVKSYAMEKLADLYRLHCLKSSDGSLNVDEYKWIPAKILRCLYDRDFRLETIELVLSRSLFPTELSVKDRVKNWVTIFSGFDKVEVKALEQILAQKQRLQQDMQKYLSLRQTYQEDATELQKRIFSCFRSMSRLFNDPVKAEENYQFLNQLKDANVWKILTSLLDPSTTSSQAWTSRDDMLRILGEKHPLYDFLGTLSLKCSNVLFNREYIKDILSEAATQQSAGNTNLIYSCMNLLAVIACYSPQFLVGCENDLVQLLKEDHEVIKEGISHVLAKAGGNIREQLGNTSSTVELLLERLCLEGTRKQAKYSVQALAAISKDDGLKSLSVLYKRLVDTLEERMHLPAILQSLGCIAQIAMPIYETREEEITKFIKSKILECNNDDEASLCMTEWSARTVLCSLKIYGIKTFVKSYLPTKDANLRRGIEKLMEILRSILSFGDVSHDIASSPADKAHMKLASAKAVLRLARLWDQNIPPDVFLLTLGISEDTSPESRKLFLSKVLQYIKERLLDAKYACAFVLCISNNQSPDYEECKRNLLEIVQICHQVKVRQLSTQSDVNSATTYPEYILAYVVYAIVHHSSCPNINETSDVQAFEPTYWRLHLFLSLLLHGDEGSSRVKESYATVVSIFHSIKHSKDAVDEAKTKTLHAICDIGLSVAKKLVHDLTAVPETELVTLPCMLYKLFNEDEYETFVEDGPTRLSSDSTLAHFEALSSKEKIHSGDVMGNIILEESDINDNEIPLGKMMEILRSKGAMKKNKKKPIKKIDLTPDLEKLKNEMDILGVVRELNLNNVERDQKTDASKSTKANKTKKKSAKDSVDKDSESQKWNMDETRLEVPSSTPKRKHSITVQQSHPSKDKKQIRNVKSPGSLAMSEKTHSTISKKKSAGKNMSGTDHLDFIVSSSPENMGTSSKKIKKGADRLQPESVKKNSEKDTVLENSGRNTKQSKGSTSITPKHKARNTFNLEKCSSVVQMNDAELVGSRVKIWWPLDKKFYEGFIQSYDSGKKKHTILYDDGDIEVLNLGKEKWESIDNGNMSKKQPKYRKASPLKKQLSKTVNNKSNHGTSRQNEGTDKRSSSKVKRKGPTKEGGHNKKRKISNAVNEELSSLESTSKSESPVRPSISSEVNHVDLENDEAKSASEESVKPEVGAEEQSDESERVGAEVEPDVSEVGAKESDEPDEEEPDTAQKEEKPECSSSHDKSDSDDEPLSAWRQRTTGKTT